MWPFSSVCDERKKRGTNSEPRFPHAGNERSSPYQKQIGLSVTAYPSIPSFYYLAFLGFYLAHRQSLSKRRLTDCSTFHPKEMFAFGNGAKKGKLASFTTRPDSWIPSTRAGGQRQQAVIILANGKTDGPDKPRPRSFRKEQWRGGSI